MKFILPLLLLCVGFSSGWFLSEKRMNKKMNEQLDIRWDVAAWIGATGYKNIIFGFLEDLEPSEFEEHRRIMLSENVLWMYRIYSELSEQTIDTEKYGKGYLRGQACYRAGNSMHLLDISTANEFRSEIGENEVLKVFFDNMDPNQTDFEKFINESVSRYQDSLLKARETITYNERTSRSSQFLSRSALQS